MTTEKKFVSVRRNDHTGEEDAAVFGTYEEAKEHAYDVFYYLSKKEREENTVFVADVTLEDLADYAFDDEEIDWRCFEQCGHEVYEEMEAPKWYAATSDEYDAWDDGSYELSEAEKIAREHIKKGESNVKIAVINEHFHQCIDEIAIEK